MANKLAGVLLTSDKKDALEFRKLYNEMPERFKECAEAMYQDFCNSGVRGLGDISAAELAVKLVSWLAAVKVIA